MNKSEKKGKRRWLKYLTNALLVLVLITLLVPSWRRGFQLWFSQLKLSEIEFSASTPIQMPNDQKNWLLFNPGGDLFNLEDFEGKPVVLSFWATWCSSCKTSFPDLGKLRSQFDDEVAFLAVTTEGTAILENSDLSEEYDFLYSAQYYPAFFEVKVFPTLVILDKELNQVYRLEGAADLNNDENVEFLNGLVQKP